MYVSAGIKRACWSRAISRSEPLGLCDRRTMRRARRDANEDHGDARGCVPRDDRREPLLADSARTTGSAWVRAAPASQSRRARRPRCRPDRRSPGRKVDAQTVERLASRMRRERSVGRRATRLLDRAHDRARPDRRLRPGSRREAPARARRDRFRARRARVDPRTSRPASEGRAGASERRRSAGPSGDRRRRGFRSRYRRRRTCRPR